LISPTYLHFFSFFAQAAKPSLWAILLMNKSEADNYKSELDNCKSKVDNRLILNQLQLVRKTNTPPGGGIRCFK